MYSIKYGANTMTSSSGFNMLLKTMFKPDAAPTVIIKFSLLKFVLNLLFIDFARISLMSSKPALLVYPCTSNGSSFSIISFIASFTFLGAGILGFPKLKSYTFSFP